jgi:tRNA1Val (adenine37-N6)-methyltransferase
MSNSYFQFKQFTVQQDQCAMKVTTDGCLFGAWVAEKVSGLDQIAIGLGVENSVPGLFNILDIGTGTGLLSLMLAQKNPSSEIDAIEIDKAAAKQAQSNADESPWKEKIFVMPGDAKDMAYTFAKEYDVIISNPPFYENELASPDDKKNMAHHDGGLLLEDLFEIIQEVLAPAGRFYIMLPYKRMTEARLLAEKYSLRVTETVMVKQSVNHHCFRIFITGQHSSSTDKTYNRSEMAIIDQNRKYTSEFTLLLKDYYLHL